MTTSQAKVGKISDRIKKSRSSIGMTQSQFSEWLGIPIGTLQGWEQGKSNPKIDTIAKIEKEFGIRGDWLISGEGEMFHNYENLPARIRSIIDQVSKKHSKVLPIIELAIGKKLAQKQAGKELQSPATENSKYETSISIDEMKETIAWQANRIRQLEQKLADLESAMGQRLSDGDELAEKLHSQRKKMKKNHNRAS